MLESAPAKIEKVEEISMRCGRSNVLCIMILLALAGPASLLLAQTADSSGCKDHPLLTRMQNMHIVMCKTVDFDRFV